MTFDELEQKVVSWAKERGLFEHSTIHDQYRKLEEEFKELGTSIRESNFDNYMDSIGDMLVVLTMMSHMTLVDLFTCYSAAYLQIKDRKGKIVDGIFIKED